MTMTKVKILLVEDNFQLYKIIRDKLTANGFHVLRHPEKSFIDNYEDAVFVCKEIPHIAVLDIELKGKKTGIDVAKYVRKNFYSPVIFITEFHTQKNREEVNKLNAGGFVRKSKNGYDIAQLVEDLRRVLPYALKADQLRNEFIELNLQSAIGKEYQLRKIEWSKLKKITSSENARNYITLYMSDGMRYECHMSLADIGSKVPPVFFKVNSGTIVNSRFIKQVELTSFRFSLDEELMQVSETYRSGHVAALLDEVLLQG